MENLLIEIHLFVSHTYDTSSNTCFQRLSNNRNQEFTDKELITIWFCAHLEGCFEKKKMHRLIFKYRRQWFPRLPLPAQEVWLCAASHHDSKAFIEQPPELPATTLFGDLAYPTPQIISHLTEQQTRLGCATRFSRRAQN